MDRGNCYCFAGGGTGGHLTPGLAVAAELAVPEDGRRILFVGSDRLLEQRMIAASGYQHRMLPVESSQTLRRNPLKFVWRNWKAYRLAQRLLHEERPLAVIGLGGFASVPVVVAATRQGIPTLLLEQNVIPGRATRWLSRRVNAVCLSFDETRSHLSPAVKTESTGNPVRREIAALCDDVHPCVHSTGSTLLILGGSQGATAVNQAVMSMVERHPSAWRQWRVVHQTGPEQATVVRDTYRRLAVEHLVEPFFQDMAALYRQATLVVSRAGATTLAELACAGNPAILVPYPHAADNHQWHNARVLEIAGAGAIVTQSADPAVTADHLAAAVLPLLDDLPRLAALRSAMRTLARPDATQRVIRTLQCLTKSC